LDNMADQNINTQRLATLRRDVKNSDTTFEYDDEGNINSL